MKLIQLQILNFQNYWRKMNKIKILVTGGTFDKEYNEISGALYFKHKERIFADVA